MILSLILGGLLLQSPDATDRVDQQKSQKAAQAEQRHQEDLKRDVDLGKKYVEEVEKSEKISTNEEYIARVQRIGGALAEIAKANQVEVTWGDKRLNPFNYTFKVLQGTQVNAFSLPGGYIYVYEGLVKYAESDDELAGVLAHEIAHAAFRHIDTLTREQSKLSTASLPAILIAIATGNPSLIIPVQLANQSFSSGWSVKAEKSADFGGLQYILKSQYNPTGMLTFMERLAIDERNNPAASVDWGIYRTHPPSRDRADAMLKGIQSNGLFVQRSAVTTSFRVQVKPGEENTVEIWFAKRRLYRFGGHDALERADEAVEKLNAFYDRTPSTIELSFDGRSIRYRRDILLTVTSEDARASNTSVDKLGQDALQAVRTGLYSVAWHVWGTD